MMRMTRTGGPLRPPRRKVEEQRHPSPRRLRRRRCRPERGVRACYLRREQRGDCPACRPVGVVGACYLWLVDPTGAPQPLREYLSAAQAERSPSRVRQLAWVVSEMVAFAATLPAPQRPADPSAWLDAGFVSRYLSDADSGRLRRRGTTERPSPDSTRRVRRACLRPLAEAGIPTFAVLGNHDYALGGPDEEPNTKIAAYLEGQLESAAAAAKLALDEAQGPLARARLFRFGRRASSKNRTSRPLCSSYRSCGRHRCRRL